MVNASLAESTCTCNDKYILTETGCKLDTQGPIPTMSVTEDNNILVSFSEPLSSELVKSDINLNVSGPREDGYEYTWELIEQD